MGAPKTKPPLPLPAQAITLDDLVAGPNTELLAAARQLAEGDPAAPSPRSVYVWGESGSGKTALLRAVCRHAAARQRPAYLVDAAQPNAMPPPSDGLLAIDDIAALPPPSQITLYDWHNRAGQMAFLASGPAAPAALPLLPDLVSRLSAGLVFRIQPLADADKQQALVALARRRGFALPPEVADLFLARLPRSMRSLAAALAELDAFLLGEQKPLTPRRAAAWLGAKQQDAASAFSATP